MTATQAIKAARDALAHLMTFDTGYRDIETLTDSYYHALSNAADDWPISRDKLHEIAAEGAQRYIDGKLWQSKE